MFVFRSIRLERSNMNAAGHSTRYRPEYGKPAHDCCLPGAGNPELAEFLAVAPRAVDKSIASLGGAAPDNTTRGVLLFSRPFIPVRKNYLTRRAGAWGLTRKRKVVS
jgi:hypothetical protein